MPRLLHFDWSPHLSGACCQSYLQQSCDGKLCVPCLFYCVFNGFKGFHKKLPAAPPGHGEQPLLQDPSWNNIVPVLLGTAMTTHLARKTAIFFLCSSSSCPSRWSIRGSRSALEVGPVRPRHHNALFHLYHYPCATVQCNGRMY